MNRSLDPELTADLRAAGILISDDQDAYGALLLAVQERGLAYRVTETRRTRRNPHAGCRCYRARVRAIGGPWGDGRPWWWAAAGMTAKGRGETIAAALARALLAWLS